MDIETLFKLAGSATRLASLAGVARTTVFDWRRTGFIPGSRVGQISKGLGISPNELLKLVQPGKTRRPDHWPQPGGTLSAQPAPPKPKTERSASAAAKPANLPKRAPKQSAESPQPQQDEAA